MADAKRGVAIIGLGMAVTPHAKSLVDLADRAEVKAAVSRSPERRAAFARHFPFPVTGDLDAVIADPAVEAVLLLTPPNARVELVERLAAAGKHILMEKPLERTTAAAERIAQAVERAGVTAGVVFQQRFRAGSERLKRLLDAGELGELAIVQLAVPWWRPQAGYYDQPGRGTLARDGGGVLISQAIHSLDLMLSMTGPVSSVAAIGGTTRLHRMETEDFMGAGLGFANGAMGSLVATTACYPGFPERLILSGTKGTAVLESGTLALAFQDGRAEQHGELSGSGGGADPMAFPHDWHRAMIADFLDAIDQHRPPRITPREALRVHRLIDALLESAATGRRVEPIVA
jgi:predicted dehydrogenase